MSVPFSTTRPARAGTRPAIVRIVVLIDAFGSVLGEDPAQPFHPRDDRIVSLGLHYHTTDDLAHDVIIDAW